MSAGSLGRAHALRCAWGGRAATSSQWKPPLLAHALLPPRARIAFPRAQILAASQELPSPYYASFVEKLADTAREDIADCAAASYRTLSLVAAQKLFMLRSRDELLRFLCERRPNFVLAGDSLVFQGGDGAAAAAEAHDAAVDSVGLLGSTLAIASDLERIV